MSSYTTLDAKNSLEAKIHGSSLNKVKNLNGLFEEAARKILSQIDPEGTIRISNLSGEVHDNVYDYSSPDDLKGRKIIDLRPQVNRGEEDRPTHRPSREFDYKKALQSFSVRMDSGVKTLRMAIDTDYSNETLHNCNDTDSNGTWAVGGDGSNLTQDDLNYVQGSASLNFDLDGSGTTGYIEISDMDSVDLEDEEDIARIFVRIYLPDASKITNAILRWGSGSSAYWSDTKTSPFNKDSFENGWNLIAFEWNGATETGSPDSSAVDYLRLTITYDGTADTDFRVDDIFASSGEIYEIEYYSEYGFSTSGGTWQQSTTEDDDVINLDMEAYQIWLDECLRLASQQLQGEDATFDFQYTDTELARAYEGYKKNHPSQAVRQRTTYYSL